MKYLSILAVVLAFTLTGCKSDIDERAAIIAGVKKACVEANGTMTVTYEAGTLTSSLTISCLYPKQGN